QTSKSNLLFLFSSSNFNDIYKRWQYLKQYDQYRKNQAARIVETQKSLERKITLQAERKSEKEKLLATEEETLVQLKSEMGEKDRLLKKLKSKERQLRGDIKKEKEQHEQLNTEIESIIKGEMTRRRESNRNAKITRTPVVDLSEKTKNFRGKRGRLPWPLDYGIVSSHFGKQAHPTIPDIQIDNSGVDIMSKPSAIVKPVFSGTVVAVRYVSGSDYLVIVQHGEYYTLYSQLEDHFVKKDDKVTRETSLGILGNDKRPELHFEVWRNNIRLNPSDWLKRK
ncbi:MAG: murein hydrolase activator EnvC family protein, partial [Saprospiraceae bacterium]